MLRAIFYNLILPTTWTFPIDCIVFCFFMQITPAHDPNDFEVGKRHNLDFINIFTDDGKINSNGGAQFEGMPRFTARVAVIEALKEKVLLDLLNYLMKIRGTNRCP